MPNENKRTRALLFVIPLFPIYLLIADKIKNNSK